MFIIGKANCQERRCIPYLAENARYGLVTPSDDTICQPIFVEMPKYKDGVYFGESEDGLQNYVFGKDNILTFPSGNILKASSSWNDHMPFGYLPDYQNNIFNSEKGYLCDQSCELLMTPQGFDSGYGNNTNVIVIGNRGVIHYYNPHTRIHRQAPYYGNFAPECFRFSIGTRPVSKSDRTGQFNYSHMFFFKEDKSCVLLDTNLNIVLDKNYRQINILDQQCLLVYDSSKQFVLVDYNGNKKSKSYNFPIFPVIGTSNLIKCWQCKGEYCLAQYIRPDGSLILQDTFTSIYQVDDHLLLVTNLSNQQGLIDTSGKIILPFIYSTLTPYTQGKFLVKETGLSENMSAQQFDSKSKKITNTPSHLKLIPTILGRYSTYKSGETTVLLNPQLAKIFKCENCTIESFYPQDAAKDVRFVVRQKASEKFQILENNGKPILLEPKKGYVLPLYWFGSDFIIYSSKNSLSDSLGIIDARNGEVILPPLYTSLAYDQNKKETIVAEHNDGRSSVFNDQFELISKTPYHRYPFLVPVIRSDTSSFIADTTIIFGHFTIILSGTNCVRTINLKSVTIFKEDTRFVNCLKLLNGGLVLDIEDKLNGSHEVLIFSNDGNLVTSVPHITHAPDLNSQYPNCLILRTQLREAVKGGLKDEKVDKTFLVDFNTGKQYRF